MFHVKAPRWGRRIYFTDIWKPKSNFLKANLHQFVRLFGFLNLQPQNYCNFPCKLFHFSWKSEKKAMKLVYYPLTNGKRKTNKRVT